MVIMCKINFLIISFTLLILSNCAAIRNTNSGYRIKGEVSKTIVIDKQLHGKCKLTGVVYSQNDSTFLSGASVTINEFTGTSTNTNGEFELELLPGIFSIKADYIGHDEQIIPSFELSANQHVILVLQLGTTATY